MSSISDLISNAINKQPIEFGENLSNILGDRATQAISGIREVLKKNICNEPISEE